TLLWRCASTPPTSTPVPYTTLFRSKIAGALQVDPAELFSAEVPSGTLQRGTLRELTIRLASLPDDQLRWIGGVIDAALKGKSRRSEEHTSELQSRENLVCRLLLEKT